MPTVLALLPWLALSAALLGTVFKGIAAILHEIYHGRALLLGLEKLGAVPTVSSNPGKVVPITRQSRSKPARAA